MADFSQASWLFAKQLIDELLAKLSARVRIPCQDNNSS